MVERKMHGGEIFLEVLNRHGVEYFIDDQDPNQTLRPYSGYACDVQIQGSAATNLKALMQIVRNLQGAPAGPCALDQPTRAPWQQRATPNPIHGTPDPSDTYTGATARS